MMRPTGKVAILSLLSAALTVFAVAPAQAQSTRISCEAFVTARETIQAQFRGQGVPIASLDLAEGVDAPPASNLRIDKILLENALASYARHNCRYGATQHYGAGQIVIVDFAKPSSQPRLYIVDLLSGRGLDTPIHVAHGIGSDPNDDGIADRFGNGYNSLMSSLGAARGAELYHGQNGLSLRLDGLEFSNSQMRVRDIVAHSYAPERRRYFNASLVAVRGKPGASEGCFVVAPEYRDWLFAVLSNGGFLFAGLGGDRAKEMPVAPAPLQQSGGEVVFVPGTGANPAAALP